MDLEEARTRCLSRPNKRYEIYSNKKRKEPRNSVKMPRNTLQPIEESNSNKGEFFSMFSLQIHNWLLEIIMLLKVIIGTSNSFLKKFDKK